jgi:hypothetical protein
MELKKSFHGRRVRQEHFKTLFQSKVVIQTPNRGTPKKSETVNFLKTGPIRGYPFFWYFWTSCNSRTPRTAMNAPARLPLSIAHCSNILLPQKMFQPLAPVLP